MRLKKIISKKESILEFTESYRKCLLWFFDYPDTEISLNDLSANLGMSKTAIRSAVMNLENEGFLIRKELGKVWRISCNKKHAYNHTLKVFIHLEMLSLTDIIEEIYKVIPGARAIILFGSYRKGDDTERSDIDIAIEIVGDNSLKIIEFGELNIGYRKNVKVNLHVFTRNKIDLNLFANIANGILLEGFFEARP